MTPTDELRNKLRRMVDEVIPAGGSDTDTRFTDAEIDELLTDASTIEDAAAEGWFRKAARAMSERGGLESSQAGDEAHKFVSLEAYRDHCMAMYQAYKQRVPGLGSRVFEFQPPDVLGGCQSG
ncbi:hypothetical protein [Alicyclobacillus macrosporangiidus]|jgi:hypothetical protein|uniref:Uncharacterized protein n=1 Tax=Alicyclobacillus macrosporangiidus TaxID=392015 RepID=A0A1I7FW05_9BACL|nr:hypothetical protein [Alicyclobacillus macrosporangiidus]SFU40330.1 hypothetical protein SAMN05421543_101478 [Alicyclobacillus macrosporangiidus]